MSSVLSNNPVTEEFTPKYYVTVRITGDNKGIVYYYAGSDNSRGVLELKLRVKDVDLIIEYAVQAGLEKKGKGTKILLYTTSDWEKYARHMLYTVMVTRVIRRFKKLMVKDAVRELGFVDLKYWVGLIVSRYRELGYKGVLRPVKALKALLKLL